MQKFEVGRKNVGGRADKFVAGKYPNFTRSALESLFDKNMISVEGSPIKASYKLKDGDRLEVDETLLVLEPPKIKLPVIYEDENVIVINKPAGVLTHSKGALNLEGTVASFIAPKVKNMEGNRAGIVHRLDRATSGVIITARNPEALSRLQKQFSKRKAKKTYIAIAHGTLEPVAAIIDAPIVRNPAKPQTFKVSAAGKPALTEYKTVKTFKKANKTYSLLELKPQTGRTHQLRVHLAYIGHPIVGDKIYGCDDNEDLLLHAESLEITLPNSERKTFSAPLPDYFRRFADA